MMPTDTTPEPGLHLNVPASVYHAWPGLSNSMLNQLDETPAHLRDYLDQDEHKTTPAMELGSAVHTAVLEPDRFEDQYVVMPEIDGRSAEARAFRKAAAKKERQVLTHLDHRWIKAIATRVRSNPYVKRWLADDPLIEASIVWEMDGYLCRMRADLICPRAGIIVDLKTTTYGMTGFPYEIRRRYYDRQAYWYLKGAENVGIDCVRFVIVAAHKSRPFLISLHEIYRDSEAYEIAGSQCERLFGVYMECMRTGQWPGYPPEPMPVMVHHREKPEHILIEEPF